MEEAYRGQNQKHTWRSYSRLQSQEMYKGREGGQIKFLITSKKKKKTLKITFLQHVALQQGWQQNKNKTNATQWRAFCSYFLLLFREEITEIAKKSLPNPVWAFTGKKNSFTKKSKRWYHSWLQLHSRRSWKMFCRFCLQHPSRWVANTPKPSLRAFPHSPTCQQKSIKTPLLIDHFFGFLFFLFCAYIQNIFEGL